MNWSTYQLAYFRDTAQGTGNTVLDAVAGSGKSTTVMAAIPHIPKDKDALITSFSTACVDDLKKKGSGGGWAGPEIRTLNSLGFRACRDEFGSLEVDTDRIYKVLDKVTGESSTVPDSRRGEFNAMRYRLKLTVDLAKNHLADKPEQIVELCDQYEIAQDVPAWAEDALGQKYEAEGNELFARMALAAMRICKKPTGGKIDFTDQIWMPAALKLDMPKYDRIFVDEAQDMCAAQVEMVFRSITKGGRLCAIGDDHQSIYGFRGAGIGMAPFVERGKATKLPLSISYRCPKAVVREAKRLVRHIEVAPNAAEGLVETINVETLPGRVRPGDAILSRTNAPLVRIFFDYLRRGIPTVIQGRDLGGALLALLNKSQARSIAALLDYVAEWQKKENAERHAKFPNCRTDSIDDRADTMRIICEISLNIDDVRRNIQRLTPPARGGERRGSQVLTGQEVVLSSVHRSKGREWTRVFLIESSFVTSEHYWRVRTKDGGASQNSKRWIRDRVAEAIRTPEDRNIRYVAITRSKSELYFAAPPV
jgi:superfamily I DNA/RNA helicase